MMHQRMVLLVDAELLFLGGAERLFMQAGIEHLPDSLVFYHTNFKMKLQLTAIQTFFEVYPLHFRPFYYLYTISLSEISKVAPIYISHFPYVRAIKIYSIKVVINIIKVLFYLRKKYVFIAPSHNIIRIDGSQAVFTSFFVLFVMKMNQ